MFSPGEGVRATNTAKWIAKIPASTVYKVMKKPVIFAVCRKKNEEN